MPTGFVTPVFQAAATIRLMTCVTQSKVNRATPTERHYRKPTKSTGMKSAMLSSLHMIVWKIPFPTAETMPVGPFQLSTHPLSGSLTLDNTESEQLIARIPRLTSM